MISLNKKILCLLLIATLIAGIFEISKRIIDVKASLDDLVVFPLKIDYGNVFPEEILEKDFTVSLSDSAEASKKTITYKVEKRQKSQNNLCDFLTVKTDKEENFLLSPTDKSDLWKVNLRVPCIEGYTPQTKDYQAIKGGNYDCEIIVRAVTAITAIAVGPSAPVIPPPTKLLPIEAKEVLGVAIVPTGSSIFVSIFISLVLTLTIYIIWYMLERPKISHSKK